jgi:hypothetical protein
MQYRNKLLLAQSALHGATGVTRYPFCSDAMHRKNVSGLSSPYAQKYIKGDHLRASIMQ